MERIFKELSSLWTSIRSKAKAKEEESIQQYKFRPRAFILDDITEDSVLELKNFVANDSLTPEWAKILDTSNPNSGVWSLLFLVFWLSFCFCLLILNFWISAEPINSWAWQSH